jgi:hypothetical protein
MESQNAYFVRCKLTLSIEDPKLTPADEKLLREEGQRDNSMIK